MKTKLHEVPLFKGDFRIIVTWDYKAVEEKYNLASTEGFEAFAFTSTDSGYNSYFVCLHPNAAPGIIAHECLHFVSFVFRDRSMLLDVENDEPQCHLLEWAVDKCHDFLKKW